MSASSGARHAPEPVDPLHGIRVVDLSTTLPGAICTQFLADSGADVLMLEPPEGSPLRAQRGWPMLGRGKRSRIVDLKSASGVSELDEVLRDADAVVTTFSPAGLSNLGIDSDALLKRHPQLVISHITGYGRSGPWRDLKGYEGLVLAKAGTLTCGAPDGESTATELSHGSLRQLCSRTHCGARHLGRPTRAAPQRARADRRRGSSSGRASDRRMELVRRDGRDPVAGGFPQCGGLDRGRLSAEPDVAGASGRANEGRPLAAVRPGLAAPVRRDADGVRSDGTSCGPEVERVSRAGGSGVVQGVLVDPAVEGGGAHAGRMAAVLRREPESVRRTVPRRSTGSRPPPAGSRGPVGGRRRPGSRSGSPAHHTDPHPTRSAAPARTRAASRRRGGGLAVRTTGCLNQNTAAAQSLR